MRPVVYSVAASLDGFIADPDGKFDWIPQDSSVDFAAIFARVDTVLIGRRSYDVVQKMDCDPPWPKAARVYLFSRTTDPDIVQDATVVSDYAAKVVQGLRSESGNGEIWLFGGGRLCASLLAADQVDRMDVTVVPVILGSGIPLVHPSGPQTKLKLTKTHEYPSGMVTLSYDVVRA